MVTCFVCELLVVLGVFADFTLGTCFVILLWLWCCIGLCFVMFGLITYWLALVGFYLF